MGCNRNHVVGLCMVGIVETLHWSQRVALCSVLVLSYKFSIDLFLHNFGSAKGYRRWRDWFRKALLFCPSSFFLNCRILFIHVSCSKLFPIWQGYDFRYDSDAIHCGLCCSSCRIYRFKRLSQIYRSIHVHHVHILPSKWCNSHQIRYSVILMTSSGLRYYYSMQINGWRHR